MTLIAGSLKDSTKVGTARGTVTFTPYNTHELRTGGDDGILGPVVEQISDVADYTIDAGVWVIEIQPLPRSGGGRAEFTPIRLEVELSTDTSWATLLEGMAQFPELTPSLVSQAQAAAASAEEDATTAQVAAQSAGEDAATAQAAAAAATAPTETQINTLLDDPESGPSQRLTATYAAGLPSIEGIPWYAYGHSYLAADSRNSPGGRYITRLNKRHLPSSLTNRATGGRLAQQVLRDMVGNQAPAWVAGSTGLVIVDMYANDVIWRGAHPTELAMLPQVVRTALAVLEAGSRVEETAAAWTYTGTWTSLTGNNVLSGSSAKSSAGTEATEAASIQFTGTGATVLTLAWDSTSGRDQGEVLIDGAPVTTAETGGFMLADGSYNYMPHAVRITGLSAGTHTLTWRRKNTRAGNIWLDALLTHSAAPPTVVLVKQPYMTAAAYTVNSIGNPGTDATVDQYNAILDTVAAEFPNAVVADPTPGWDKTTMWGADGYHPNDRGMAHIAAAIEVAVREVGWRQGQNLLTS